jgi:hypothetical protein
MRDFFNLVFLAVLVGFTGLAAHMWYSSRKEPMEAAKRQVFNRFVAGLAVFWLVALAGYVSGFFSR